MGRTLQASPVEVSSDGSAIAPVLIEGLPAQIEALGRRWQRKTEFHLTVLARSVIEEIGAADRGQVARALEGRSVDPIYVTRELRRVGGHPDKPGLETIVVMVECPGLTTIYGELSLELGFDLTPPPAHVTLFSTDPEQGIGISNEVQLRERAPALGEEEHEEVRRATGFEAVFGGAI